MSEFLFEKAKFCTSGKVLAYAGQRTPFHLGLFNSPIAGTGLKVTFGKIPSGWPVIRYVGPILTQEQSVAKWNYLHKLPGKNPRVEFFGVDDEHVIDGQQCIATYANHSCEPNLLVHVDVGRIAVVFVANREIFQDEELTIDYQLQGGSGLTPCKCGAATCRGYMNNPAQIEAELGAKQHE